MQTATLSPMEQRIYFAAKNAKDGVIFLDIIRSWNLTDDATLLATLSRMAKKNWLILLRKGVYLVNESPGVPLQDPFVIATYIFPGYVAFSSALYLHQLTDEVPFEVQVATRNAYGTKTFGEYSFRAIPIRKRYMGSEKKNNHLLSTLAKTLYDCLTHPGLAGGYPTLAKALYEAPLSKKDWGEFFYYAEKFEPSAFYQRLGYLLSVLPKKNSEILRAIRRCQKKVRSKVYLYQRRKGKYVSPWKLVDDVGKEALLSWWY